MSGVKEEIEISTLLTPKMDGFPVLNLPCIITVCMQHCCSATVFLLLLGWIVQFHLFKGAKATYYTHVNTVIVSHTVVLQSVLKFKSK